MPRRTFPLIFIVIAVGLILLGSWWLWRSSYQGLPRQTVVISGQTFDLEVADDPEERALGLSGRDTLDSGDGMIFRGFTPGQLSFWMKDMRFDIDMIWIDADDKVVHIEHAVSEDSYPTSYRNPVDTTAAAVIELAAGTCRKIGLDVGESVQLEP